MTVALIDTGVTPVPGLDIPGKVVNGPDLSFEGQGPTTRWLDGYGHGTHMAGLIAGRDAGSTGHEKDKKYFVGMAPDARILNMKVATADGGADVTQVIAAIDWVVQHRNDNGLNVRVINLSYGTPGRQGYESDPLARAVENAWKAGIVVVAAAGNDGATATSLTMPAADPYVIAVGASAHGGTKSHKDDRVSDFTNPGTGTRRPDLLAPGKSLVSLRVPGSTADSEHAEGLVTGDKDARFFRGSGTSQAAAVISGAVAVVLQARPTATPDQVKKLLIDSAEGMEAEQNPARGAGQLDLEEALKLETPSATSSRQTWAPSTGLGSLDLTRALPAWSTRRTASSWRAMWTRSAITGTDGAGRPLRHKEPPGPAGHGTDAAGPVTTGRDGVGPATAGSGEGGAEPARSERIDEANPPDPPATIRRPPASD